MLKIRDDVDLKELEKFGFEHFENGCGTTGYSKDYLKFLESFGEASVNVGGGISDTIYTYKGVFI